MYDSIVVLYLPLDCSLVDFALLCPMKSRDRQGSFVEVPDKVGFNVRHAHGATIVYSYWAAVDVEGGCCSSRVWSDGEAGNGWHIPSP